MFKDHALGLSGNVFRFVKELFRYDILNDALTRINVDFELELLGGNNTIQSTGNKPKLVSSFKTKEKIEDIKIHSMDKVTQEYTNFWKQLGISKNTLKSYFVTQVDIIQFVYKSKTKVIYPKELTIAYRIYRKYKLYSPYEDKALKFRNNYPISYIEGYLQLKYTNDFLVITKSMKEVIFFREHFDFDAVSGKSENTMIKRHMMLKLVQRFKHIYILLDNDVAGIRAQKNYLKEYPFLISLFLDAREKDVTDFYVASPNKEKALQTIKNLIDGSKRYKRNGAISWR